MIKGIKTVIILIFIPLVTGYILNRVALYFFMPPIISQIIFTAFWFWVGYRFTLLPWNKLKSFIVGNSIWLLSLLLFIWQFVVLDDESRNLILAGLSQNYIVGFLWSGVKWASVMYDSQLTTLNVTISSFIFMFLTFTVGFIYSWVKQYRDAVNEKITMGKSME
ncbi:hypothetical protein GCM10008967_30100 [Bacillus carboniphilus]|uniref:Uncharacterized protein n=1 Tax=Bacillus carboniphilus TaxID=86663 RepID=A0ABP3G862_9BACI